MSCLNRIVLTAILLLISLFPEAVQAADPREISVGLTLAEFQTAFDRKLSEQVVPLQVSSYPARQEEHYTVIWNPRPLVSVELQAGLDPDELKEAVEIRAPKGQYPAQLVPYSLGKDLRFLVLFEGGQANLPQIRHGLLRKEVAETTGELQKNDYYPMQVTGYNFEGKERFAGIWNHSDVLQTEAELGLTLVLLEKRIKEQKSRGVFIKRFNVYKQGPRELYTIVWEQRKGPAQEFRSKMTAAVLESTNDEFAKDGFQIVQIWGYESQGRDRFSAIWEATATLE